MKRLLLSSALLCAAVLPAAARPRDEVMSNAFRCAPIGDLRLWLDCFYGAAQPVRASLAMPPAPQAQLKLVTAPPSGPVGPQDAKLRDGVLAQAFRCNDVTDERQWLSCYYDAATSVRARLGLLPASAARPPTPAAPAFGMAAKPRNEIPDSADHITARMTRYAFDGDGMFTVTLDNGQTWRQVPGDTDYARWKKPAASYVVRISHGALRSYNLQVTGMAGTYKVRREQ